MTESKMNDPARRPRLRLVAVLMAAAFLGGCASFSPDGGFAPVEQAAKERLGKELRWARTDAERDTLDQRVAELLAAPLSVDDAVQVALFNNRGLQATFLELGISEAELVQAGRLPNPGFSYSRQKQGGEVEIERLLVFNLAHLLAMPMISEIEQRRFAQTQALVTMQVLALAADTRKAYFMAVSAGETVRYMRQVMQAAEASAELARRMQQVGNFNKLQRAREQSFYADAAQNLARAEQAERAARERLTRLLGVWGAQTSLQAARALARSAGHGARAAGHRTLGHDAAAGCAGCQAGRRADGEEPGADAGDALRQRARGRWHLQHLQ